jgi:hypothetical protein
MPWPARKLRSHDVNCGGRNPDGLPKVFLTASTIHANGLLICNVLLILNHRAMGRSGADLKEENPVDFSNGQSLNVLRIPFCEVIPPRCGGVKRICS